MYNKQLWEANESLLNPMGQRQWAYIINYDTCIYDPPPTTLHPQGVYWNHLTINKPFLLVFCELKAWDHGVSECAVGPVLTSALMIPDLNQILAQSSQS